MSNLFYQNLQDKSDGNYEKEIYNKAIDEFTKELRMYINNGEMNTPNIKNKMAIISNRIVEEMAEQLKEGK